MSYKMLYQNYTEATEESRLRSLLIERVCMWKGIKLGDENQKAVVRIGHFKIDGFEVEE